MDLVGPSRVAIGEQPTVASAVIHRPPVEPGVEIALVERQID